MGLLALLWLVPALALAQDADPLRGEANRRSDALVHEGYNLTQAWTLETGKEKRTTRLEFQVPPPGQEHSFSFWAETAAGQLAYRLVGPDGQLLASWSGRTGETTVTRAAPPGRYAVEVDHSSEATTHAVFGVKGPALRRCDTTTGTVEEHAASIPRGYHWPYLLFVPSTVRSERLLVVPNNTGFVTEDLDLLRMSGSCEVRRQEVLAEQLGTPLLVPLFPRPTAGGDVDNLYLHALSRASLETTIAAFQRVDLQLVAMIDDARAVLRERRAPIDPRVLLWGFSASGSFVSRFAVLHPERVAAVASGSPGGWPIAPLAEIEGEQLGFPVGIADVKALTGRPLDRTALRRVAWLFYLGADDENDSVPYRDSFSRADEELVRRRFGKTPAERWLAAERLYHEAGLQARFELYPTAAHSLTREMKADVAAFLAGVAPAAVR